MVKPTHIAYRIPFAMLKGVATNGGASRTVLSAMDLPLLHPAVRWRRHDPAAASLVRPAFVFFLCPAGGELVAGHDLDSGRLPLDEAHQGVNVGQKLQFWDIVWGCVAYVITGVIMWFPTVFGRILVSVSYVIHDLSA